LSQVSSLATASVVSLPSSPVMNELDGWSCDLRSERWIFFSLDQILATSRLDCFNNIVIKISTIHAEQDFEIIRFNMGNDFYNHFGCAIGSVCAAASYKSSDISLQIIAEGELDVVTVVPEVLGIVSFDSTFLIIFYIDHTVVDINGDDFEDILASTAGFALPQEGTNFQQVFHLGENRLESRLQIGLRQSASRK